MIRIAIALAVIASLAACRKTGPAASATEHHALPGFSLALPAGEVLEDESKAYAKGNYTVGVKGTWVVMVAWENGPLSDSERHTYTDSWKLELDHPLKQLAVPNLATETYAGTNHGPARVSFVMCGKRHVIIASLAHDGVDELHAGVLTTFTCTPDTSKERAVGARIDLADRAGWLRVGDHPDVVMLERDGGAKLVLALFYTTEPTKAVLDALVTKYQGTLGDGDPRPLTSPLVRGWEHTLHCGDEHWVVALYVETGSGAADRSVIDGVHCQRPDEADLAWPPAPPELQQLAN